MPSENRPAPAVGQVWRDTVGRRFVIQPGRLHGKRLSKNFENGWSFGEYSMAGECVQDTDTYVGQFRGFKVEGME